MKILSIGDIIGKPGRDAVRTVLPAIKSNLNIDMIVANGENVAGGIGITASTAEELLHCGVDVITSGNHIWAQKDIYPYLDGRVPIIRPLNYPPGVPGKGYITIDNVAVVNLIGRTFFAASYDDPFRGMDLLLTELSPDVKVIIIDFHAEATSEKMALGRYLDGRVSAVLGTHTHVGTIDAQVLPGGTAFVTDIGMTGPLNSIIGDDNQVVLQRFLTQIPHRMMVANESKVVFNAIVVEVDERSGHSLSIERLQRVVDV
ncbi:MAG: TIGR00282 family metallophosphoesterase [Dehalococcoidia bacterium]|nr:TIGR00282 family metallophosphoesterase [Dehalococcoidia bacterium]